MVSGFLQQNKGPPFELAVEIEKIDGLFVCFFDGYRP